MKYLPLPANLNFLGLVLALVLIMGCNHSVTVSGQFPSPMINPLPINIAIYYSPEFQDYTYREASEDRSKWTVQAGAAQVELFNTVLPPLFEHSQILNTYEPGGPLALAATQTVDDSTPVSVSPALVLVPSLYEFQYAVPNETKVNVFEVWLKYNLQLFDQQGSLVADWIVTAYGKTPTAFMTSAQEALNQAVIIALRDAGANLSINLPRKPEIRTWLNDHRHATPEPKGSENTDGGNLSAKPAEQSSNSVLGRQS